MEEAVRVQEQVLSELQMSRDNLKVAVQAASNRGESLVRMALIPVCQFIERAFSGVALKCIMRTQTRTPSSISVRREQSLSL